jgi:amino acid adenylation domain-containing protein
MTPYQKAQHAQTLVEMLESQASTIGDRTAFRFLHPGKKDTITYRQLSEKAQVIACELLKNIRPGERAILLYAPGLEFICVFLGCLYAGVIAVPLYPPVNKSLVNKLQGIIEDTKPSIILSSSEIYRQIKKLKLLKQFNKLRPLQGIIKKTLGDRYNLMEWQFENFIWLVTDRLSKTSQTLWRMPPIDGKNIAFLQYTSGSTSFPKGVMVSHQNLLANLKLIAEAYGVESLPLEFCYSWLPLYHDMGLIGPVLTTLLSGKTAILTSPFRFLKDPYSWLNDLSQLKIAASVAPNFAYDYCIHKVTEEQKQQLNLSYWKIAINGSESIHLSSLEKFYKMFKSCGFKRETFFPNYGLAEATLMVSCKPKNTVYKYLSLDKKDFKKGKITITQEGSVKNIVSCGHAYQELYIVDPNSHQICEENHLGEIWITGPSVAQGYWNNPVESNKIFEAKIKDDTKKRSFLRTGDMGFLHEGELYISGRIKDLILIHGENYYPQDFEITVSEAHPKIRPGCAAAFSIEIAENEQLAIVTEIKDSVAENEYQNIAQNILERIEKDHELSVYSIALMPPRGVLKTTSGKIRRSAIKEKMLNKSLSALYWWSHEDISNQSPYVAPSTQIEKLVCNELSQVFNKKIGLQDNFFSLGGDSLVAMQLISKIQDEFLIELTPEFFFDHPKVSDLTQTLEKKLKLKQPATEPSAIYREKEQYLPLSYSQQRLWLLDILSPNNPFYNLAISITINGIINSNALEKALNFVVRRHEILRTSFLQHAGQPYQAVHSDIEILIDKINFSKTSTEQISRYIRSKVEQPFTLAEYPLFRFTLLVISKKKHVFLLMLHHIIADAWSLPIFLKELAIAYNSYITNTQPQLPELPLQYADFSLWQRSETQQLAYQKELKYWLTKLSNLKDTLQLLTDKPRPITPSYQGSSVYFSIPEQLATELKQLSQESSVSLFMFFLAIFYILLYRYSQQEDLIIGSPISNRNLAGVKNLIGFFVNIIALRVNCHGDQTFADFLMKVRKTVLEAMNNKNIPFEQVVEAVNPIRSANIQPLFQVLFVYQDFSQLALNLDDATSNINFEPVMTKFDVTLEITVKEAKFEGRIEFASDLFYEETIKKIANHYVNLAQAIVSAPHSKISDLEILSTEEKQRLLSASSKERPLETQILLHHYIEEQARLTPYNIAIIAGSQKLNYQQLNQQANQLANILLKNNVKPGMLVPIMMERSIDLAIGLLAVAKSGAVSVPLDPIYPEPRLKFILDDVHAQLILTQKKYANIDLLNSYETIAYDSGNIQEQNLPNIDINDQNTSLAFIIYTSGSTGNPKGVKLTHEGLGSRLMWLKENLPLTGDDSLLHQFSLSFDAGIIYLFWPLSVGAKVIIPSNQDLNDVVELKKRIEENSVTVISSIPTVLQNLIPILDNKPSLKYIISGGESFSKDLFKLITKKSDASILNLYGPTECSVFATSYRPRLPLVATNFIPIGKPINNTNLYLLDDNGKLVPEGFPGEVFLGGQGLALGYLNRPELTAQRFIEHTELKQKLYRTGDIARFLPDGNLEFIGRKDFQLKVSGYRIEPEEIETAINSHPDVKESAVVLNKSKRSQSLVGYYVLKSSQKQIEPTNLRNFLLAKIPSYMVPVQFEELDMIPRLPNNKIDRSSLVILSQKLTIVDYQPPAGNLENQISRIWESLLDHRPIGIRDNFFRVGGDSLMALRLLAKMNQELKVKLSLDFLFEYQTIAEQSDFIEHHKFAKHYDNIIKLNTNKNGQKIFFIHPVGGRILPYQLLANLLEKEFAVYGIESIGILKGTEPLHSIAEMADYYVTQIKQIQPTGPYALLGWSMGGLIAFEMARKLNSADQQVSLLVMLDTQNPQKVPKIKNVSTAAYYKNLAHLIDDAVRYLNPSGSSQKVNFIIACMKVLKDKFKYLIPLISLMRLNPMELNIRKFDYYSELFKKDIATRGPRQLPIDQLLNHLENAKVITPILDHEQLVQFYENLRSSFYASEHYQPHYFNGPILYFTAGEKTSEYDWDGLADSIKIIKLPVDHYNLMRHLRSLNIIKDTLIEEIKNGRK